MAWTQGRAGTLACTRCRRGDLPFAGRAHLSRLSVCPVPCQASHSTSCTLLTYPTCSDTYLPSRYLPSCDLRVTYHAPHVIYPHCDLLHVKCAPCVTHPGRRLPLELAPPRYAALCAPFYIFSRVAGRHHGRRRPQEVRMQGKRYGNLSYTTGASRPSPSTPLREPLPFGRPGGRGEVVPRT